MVAVPDIYRFLDPIEQTPERRQAAMAATAALMRKHLNEIIQLEVDHDELVTKYETYIADNNGEWASRVEARIKLVKMRRENLILAVACAGRKAARIASNDYIITECTAGTALDRAARMIIEDVVVGREGWAM